MPPDRAQPPRSLFRRRDWRSAVLWIGCFVLTLVVMGWVTREESDRRLEQDAEQAARRWSSFFSQSVPELDKLFATGKLTPASRERLLRLPRDQDLFLVRLFDREGRPIPLPDDVARIVMTGQEGGKDAPLEQPDAGWIRKQVLTGMSQVVLRRSGGAERPPVYSEAYVPVRQNDSVLGLVALYVDQTNRAASAAEGLVRIAVVVTALLLVLGGMATYQYVQRQRTQRKADAKLRYLARHDVLSGALNRASFNEALSQAALVRAARGPAFSVLRINLDGFKQVNESLGHSLGDKVLRVTTRRLETCLRDGDRLARLGGDEFAVLLTGPATVEAVTPKARQIVQTLAEPFELSGHTVRCSASIGIALHGPDGTEPDELMTRADLALFRAKSIGRGSFSFHDAELDQQLQSRREVARDLGKALSAEQLSVHYQPLYAGDGNLLVGYEALLRWQHPEHGKVSPGEFIPLAEQAGLIAEIGLWVLRRACKDASGWPQPLGVAVNLSADQFTSGKLVEHVARALADSGLEAQRLCLEITESLLMNNSEQVMATLRNLAGLGASIAMDDFGTGYSSLAYLWRFPFDKVKIDQVFTRNLVLDPKVTMIVRSIITLAHSLDMRVNAEGVETRDQLAALQELGCDELQGFLLGRPTPESSLTHVGHIAGRHFAAPRGEARESLFADIPMDLPSVHSTL